MEDPSDVSTWSAAMRRLTGALRPRSGRRSIWSVLVPVVSLLAGLLFTASVTTSRGTDLRDDRTPQLAGLISERQRQVDAASAQEASLRATVLSQTSLVAGTDSDVASQQTRADGQLDAAGLTIVHGPGMTVALNDAPRPLDGTLPKGATDDDIVVHQQDVQAVVNALWAGGAEAMMIMGVRVISTSAVRCVGNTLLLEGRVYSPPFVITAIGNPTDMGAALDTSPIVKIYREDVAAWGLGYEVTPEGDVTLPAFAGSTALVYATVPK